MTAPYSMLIRQATVIDGTGAPRRDADVALQGDRIARIAPVIDARADLEFDARGRVVAPGFIDVHTHDDRALLTEPAMTPKVSQGVTTVITGHCGISLAPLALEGRPPPPPLDLMDPSGAAFRHADFAGYLRALRAAPAAVNAAPLVGHTTLRVGAMADLGRTATEAEVALMRERLAQALADGAIGVSTGTFYPPAAAATTEELIEVCRPLAEHGGLYATHLRDETDRVLDAIDETLLIGRALGVPVLISHHKVVGRGNFGRSRETLAAIAEAMRGQPVCLDCYPYDASSTVLSAARIGLARKVLVTGSGPHPEVAGQDLEQIARGWGVSREEAVARLQPAGAIYFSMDEADVQRILSFGPTMIGSDGLPHDARPHPRLWGTFPRVLGHYSRRLGLFPLETAVHKMTGLPAATFGLADRGALREGAFADLVLFDPDGVDERASFDEPTRPAAGIDLVAVNGVPVWRDAAPTGARPGRVLGRTKTARA